MSRINFVFDDDDSGRIKGIYRDGELLTKPIRVEQPQGIVQTYFKSAMRNFKAMNDERDDHEENRHFGLQAFLMSLVGLEAFLNVFFHKVGLDKGLPDVVKVALSREFSVEHKIKNLAFPCFGRGLKGSKRLNQKIRELYDLRNDIVHAKWEPVTLGMSGIIFEGMSDNFQQAFEDREFVREALRWCLLVIARVGDAQGPEVARMFLPLWTSVNETNESLTDALGIDW